MAIVAIATAIGEAGIGIVRMSGSDSSDILNEVFRGSKDPINHNRELLYGHIIDEGEFIDEVMAVFMKAPKSYTCEDMVEIYCHGGIVSVRRVLELLLSKGARLAEPGEFTKLAFLNGRIDLSQAEAVSDLISAKTEKSFDASLRQLEGGLSREIKGIMELIIEMVANVEVSIDYPEADIEFMELSELKERSLKVREGLEKLLKTARRGKLLRDGMKTVILGKPNVGKSSLLNALTGEERAIVTDIPGTTRDTLEEFVNIGGVPLRIVDTAGIRFTDDIVEKIGVERAVSAIETADLIIAVFDTSSTLDKEDEEILKLIEGRKSIVLMNKSDLEKQISKDILKQFDEKDIIWSSMLKNEGIVELENRIQDILYDGEIELKSDVVISNIRHSDLIDKALKCIETVIADIEAGVPVDCVEVDLRAAWEYLGEITGDTVGEDIIDKIFKNFCLGK